MQPAYAWSVTNSTSMEPGKVVDFTYGSSADNIWIIRLLDKKNQPGKPPMPLKKTTAASPSPTEIKEGPFSFIRQNKDIQTVKVPVTEDDRGGFMITQVFVKHNRVFENGKMVAVPWNNKELNVSVQSFRDKMEPGSKEKWTLTITGHKGEKISAEILTSLYDASLDQFKEHHWNKPSVFPVLYNPAGWNHNQNFELSRSQTKYVTDKYINVPGVTYDQFIWQTGEFRYGYGRQKMMKTESLMVANEME